MNKAVLILLTIVAMGCSDNGIQTIERKMVVSPLQLTFEHGVDSMAVSITHTCTCAFSWTATVTPPNGVLKDTNASGDSPIAYIRIADRSKMTSDTIYNTIVVSNNSPELYGRDTIEVTVIR